MILTFVFILSIWDSVFTLKGDGGAASRAARLDCVKASEHCQREYSCSTKYRMMRQCVAGRESNFSAVTGPEAQGECRSAIDAMKQSSLNNCRCRRGMKKEKNCLRIFWSIFQSLQGNDLLEYSPYEPVNSRLSDIFRLAPIIAAEPASTKENNCLSAAKACNLNDTCKKYRSAYINPCTSRVSASEVCNKRKCHKALRQFFDKVPPKHSYGMLFCSCPAGDQMACAERRRQTIVPICSYEDKDKPNCLSLQNTCKTNYICRSRLADFLSNCQPEVGSISGCLLENYANCLLSYSGLIGTVMTPNYVRSSGISLSPWCDCSNSGNSKPDCDKFAEFFTNNRCLRNAIKAFGNGTDVGVWQPQPPIQPTVEPSITRRGKAWTNSVVDVLTDVNQLGANSDSYHICGPLQYWLCCPCDGNLLEPDSKTETFVSKHSAKMAKIHPKNHTDVLQSDGTKTELSINRGGKESTLHITMWDQTYIQMNENQNKMKILGWPNQRLELILTENLLESPEEVQNLVSNQTAKAAFCPNHQLDESGTLNAIAGSSPSELNSLHLSTLVFSVASTALQLKGFLFL